MFWCILNHYQVDLRMVQDGLKHHQFLSFQIDGLGVRNCLVVTFFFSLHNCFIPTIYISAFQIFLFCFHLSPRVLFLGLLAFTFLFPPEISSPKGSGSSMGPVDEDLYACVFYSYH